MQNEIISDRVHEDPGRRLFILIALLILMGIVFRTVQYSRAVSLWHDELALALNFQERSLSEFLTQPLDYKQVAATGFIAVVKLASNIFGLNEYGFRFIPWLFGVASIFLFWRVAKRFISGPVILSGLGLFVVSPALIWYGASAKPYGCDIAVTLLLVLLALRYLEHENEIRDSIISGIAGGIALLFSQAAVFTGFVLCWLLLVRYFATKPRSSLKSLAILCVSWAIGAGVTSAFSILLMDPATNQYMHEFWSTRGGFPPPVSQLGDYLLWFPYQLFSVFAHFLIFVTPPILVLMFVVLPAVLAILGLLFLKRKNFWMEALLISPVIAGLLAAAAGILPFRQRVGVYAGWPILILAMQGIVGLYLWLPGHSKLVPKIISFIIVIPLMLTVLFLERPPYRSQESQPVLMKLKQNNQPGDQLYVFCGAKLAMKYYGPRVGLDHWTEGGCNYDQPESFKEDVERLRGQQRVWFFYTQSHHNQAQLLKTYFESIGKQLFAIPDPAGSTGEEETAAYLYDLSGN